MKKNQVAITQRLGFLFLALLYGLFGSPSPDQPGLTEVSIFFCLLMVIGVSGLARPLHYFTQNTSSSLFSAPFFWLLLLFIWGTFLPLLTGFTNGNNSGWIARDYAGFLLLCLPLFVMPYLSIPDFKRFVVWSMTVVGVLFSIRVLNDITADTGTVDALYLSVSPEILFTACFCGLSCLSTLFLKTYPFRVFILWLCLFSSTLLVLYLNTMRAGLGILFLSIVLFTLWSVTYYPKRAFLMLAVLIVIAISYNQSIYLIAQPFIEKQQSVGLNQRLEEFRAVSDQHHGSTLNSIIGLGWGAGIESPSSKGMMVNFTHNLFSSLWLKTGLIGVFLMCAFLISTFYKIFRTVSLYDARAVILFLSLMSCLSVNVLLYGGYKSLGFGLCLTALLGLCFSEQKQTKKAQPIAQPA